jgi:hypothetical protein
LTRSTVDNDRERRKHVGTIEFRKLRSTLRILKRTGEVSRYPFAGADEDWADPA